MSNNPLQLCMLSGSFEYDSETSLTRFRDYIEDNHPVQSTLIIYQTENDDQSLEPLEDADVLLVFTRRLNTTGRELERLRAYCAQGKPIVGVRTASHAYQNWLAFDQEVLGGNYQGHYGSGQIARVEIEHGAEGHPILHGISNFDSYGSLYKNTPLVADTTLLLTGKTEEHTEPVAWTRLHRGGRVFYTSLGHQKDFAVEMFLRLLANAVFWAAGRL
ncbi:MAG: ThuA domain-containing protein [Candidatus Poribacteria bacterium]|nr:ThuA domain-containing protein [Candidatus Poribacteria bacterium]